MARVILRGGPRDGQPLDLKVLTSRVMTPGPATESGFSEVVYRRTDEIEDDMPVYRIEVQPPSQARVRAANARLHAINIKGDLDRLVVDVGRVAQSPQSVAVKMQRLYAIADRATELARPHSPCKRNCSACCYQTVIISSQEAAAIGRAIKRKPAQLPDSYAVRPDQSRAEISERMTSRRDDYTERYRGVPCTFLVDGLCSIYASRPLACRQLVSLDDSASHCEIGPIAGIKVAYMNLGYITNTAAAINMFDRYADIREYFPPQEK